MRRAREVREGLRGCRKSVKADQAKCVCVCVVVGGGGDSGWRGCYVVILEAARLVACSPLDMRL